jgi:hypothetical protein
MHDYELRGRGLGKRQPFGNKMIARVATRRLHTVWPWGWNGDFGQVTPTGFGVLRAWRCYKQVTPTGFWTSHHKPGSPDG